LNDSNVGGVNPEHRSIGATRVSRGFICESCPKNSRRQTEGRLFSAYESCEPFLEKAEGQFAVGKLQSEQRQNLFGAADGKGQKGETVYIIRGQQRFILQEVPPIDPIPLRPAGYFANACSRAEIHEENRLAKASAIRAPKDLE
jgi:hypothetical protein